MHAFLMWLTNMLLERFANVSYSHAIFAYQCQVHPISISALRSHKTRPGGSNSYHHHCLHQQHHIYNHRRHQMPYSIKSERTHNISMWLWYASAPIERSAPSHIIGIYDIKYLLMIRACSGQHTRACLIWHPNNHSNHGNRVNNPCSTQ